MICREMLGLFGYGNQRLNFWKWECTSDAFEYLSLL